MNQLWRILLAATAVFTLSACGISGNLSNDPGYAVFRSPGFLDTDRQFALSLGPLPIKLARRFIDDDPDVLAILEHLLAVRVYVYEVDASSEKVRQRMDLVAANLEEQGWMPIVAIREDNESTTVLVSTDDQDQIRGLAVVSLDSRELVFVNLIGKIQPEMFGTYLAELDIDLPAVVIDPI